jgi:hypothetical protein
MFLSIFTLNYNTGVIIMNISKSFLKNSITYLFIILTYGFGQTNVSGVISSNTTWSLISSPYIVTGNILVNEDVTLIIEPGVVVKFDSEKVMQIKGELIAQGTSSSKITFTSNAFSPSAGDWGNLQFFGESTDASYSDGSYSSGSIMEYCIVEYGIGLSIEESSPLINYSEIRFNSGYGINTYNPNTTTLLWVTNCDIHDNSGGITAYNPYNTDYTVFSYNTVYSNTPNGGINANYGCTFSYNTIKNNTHSNNNSAGGINVGGDNNIHHNIISGNTSNNGTGGMRVSAQSSDVYDNIIFNNTGSYALEVDDSSPSSFTRNIIIGGVTYFEPSYNTHSYTNNIFAGGLVGSIEFGNDADFSNNTILNGSGSSLSIYGDNDNNQLNQNVYFSNNLFSLNSSGSNLQLSSSGSGQTYLTTTQNNIINNDGFYVKASSENTSVENNWWGTTTESEIQALIYDWNEDSELGFLDYDPWLTTPNTSAPISPPFNAEKQLIENSGDIVVTWDSNPESDLTGYYVHYGDFTGYSYVNNVDVGNVNTFTLSGISFDSNISVTAYDSDANGTDDQVEGHQSWFANVTFNVAPISVDASYELNEDSILNNNLTASDEENDPLVYSIIETTLNGVLELNNETGAVTYTPNLNYFGADSFSFLVNDGMYNSNDATVSIQINPVNDAPVLETIANHTINEDYEGDTQITISATDVENDEIQFSSSSSEFVSTNIQNLSVYVTPLLNWYGQEEIFIYASDPGGLMDTTSFILTVLPINDAPVGVSFSVSIEEDNVLNSVLIATDAESDQITFSLVNVSNGSADLNSESGEFTYTPNMNYNGLDTLSFTVSDGTDVSEETLVFFEISPVNDAPLFTTISDTSMNEDSPLSLELVATDVDGDFLSFEVEYIEHIASYVYADGDSIMFVPENNWSGVSNVQLYVMDGEGLSDSVDFMLTVNPVDDDPTLDGFMEDIFVYEDFQDTLTFPLNHLFSDIDGELTFSVEILDSVLINAIIEDTLLILNSFQNSFGQGQMIITASNPMRASVSDTVIVTVFAENDAPVLLLPDSIVMDEDQTFELMSMAELMEAGILTDIDNDIEDLNFGLYIDNLQIHVEWDGEYSSNPLLVPDENYNGTGTLTLCVNDDEYEVCAENTVTIIPGNDAPFFAAEMHASVGLNLDFHVPVHVDDIDSDSLTVSFPDGAVVQDWVSIYNNSLHGMPDTLGHFPLLLSLSDGDTAVTDTFHLHVENFNPEITSIMDVPNDQGGRVYVSFNASFFDDLEYVGEEYGIMRYDYFENDSSRWVALTSFPAIGDFTYTFEVTTVMDSTSEGDGMTEYKVVASMHAGIYHSEPMMGYSLDNIAPGVPGGLMVTALDEGIHLTWDVNVEEDFQYFILEKSLNSEFQEYQTYEMIDTTYIDLEYVLNETNYYRLAAVDYAGNVSEYSDMVEATLLSLVGDLTPEVFALHQNYPNPFNPITQIKYDIPEDALVSITIYDIMGRSIKSLVNSNQTAGYHSISWDGKNNLGEGVSAGMYLYMIQAGEFRQVRKMVLLK